MSDSSPATHAKLQRAREEQEYWKLKNSAANLRAETEALNPGMAGVQAGNRLGGSSLSERLKENYVSALEVKQFRDIVEGVGSKPHLSPAEILDRKAAVAESLARMGKTPAEIEAFMLKVGPLIEPMSNYSDPLTIQMLYARAMGGEERFGVQQIVETIKLIDQLKSPQPRNELGPMVDAMARMFTASVQATQNQNQSHQDPAAAFQAGIQAIQPLYQQMNENTRIMMQTQIDNVKVELARNDPAKFMETMQKYQEQFGLSRGEESEDIRMHRLNMEEQDRSRIFQLEREKWQALLQEKKERAQSQQQAELVRNITGAAQKIFESPVAKELGKSVGSRIGVKNNPVSQIQSQAAVGQLQNPMEDTWGFTCPKCNTAHTFTSLQLEKIREAGGRWVCSTGGCGAPYMLQDPKKSV